MVRVGVRNSWCNHYTLWLNRLCTGRHAAEHNEDAVGRHLVRVRGRGRGRVRVRGRLGHDQPEQRLVGVKGEGEGEG